LVFELNIGLYPFLAVSRLNFKDLNPVGLKLYLRIESSFSTLREDENQGLTLNRGSFSVSA
jgi:hypothetical protein